MATIATGVLSAATKQWRRPVYKAQSQRAGLSAMLALALIVPARAQAGAII